MAKVESYQGLARKWRPQTLDDLVGQEAVAQSLGNALRGGRVVHGHLLAGPRGTGKTTTARILAKALNCAQGPTDKPCGVCRHCIDITAGNDMDVIEIDAASNTGVDNIRELRERVSHAPFAARHKIYIIDEIHMLSIAAFNALLKTLEEPPPFVVFIFATTELEKVPETIRSRCVVHHFRRLSTDDIARRLTQVAEGEGVKLDPAQTREIYGLIARSVDGGMRDALVQLDQLLALTEGKPDAESAIKLLGLADRGVLSQTVEWLAKGEAGQLLGLIEDLVGRGRSLDRFVKSLIAYLRDLMLLQSGADERLVAMTGEALDGARGQARSLAPATLYNLLHHLFGLEERIKQSTQARFLVEFTFLRLAAIKPVVPIDDILKRIQALPEGAFTPPAGIAPSASPPASINPPEAKPRPMRRMSEEPAAGLSAAVYHDASPSPSGEPDAPLSSAPSGDQAQSGSGLIDQLVLRLPDSSRFLQRYLSKTAYLAIDGGTLRVVWPTQGPSLARRMIDRPENTQAIERTLEQMFGRSIKLLHEIADPSTPSPNPSENGLSTNDGPATKPPHNNPPVMKDSSPETAPSVAPSTFSVTAALVGSEDSAMDDEDGIAAWGEALLDSPPAQNKPSSDRRSALEKAKAMLTDNAEAARRIKLVRDFFNGRMIDDQGKPLPI